MPTGKQPQSGAAPSSDRDRRLRKALRENLRRRKRQAEKGEDGGEFLRRDRGLAAPAPAPDE